MKATEQMEADRLQAIVYKSPEKCMVFVAAKNAHHFGRIPQDGRTYIVQDLRRSWISHWYYPDGRYLHHDDKSKPNKVGSSTHEIHAGIRVDYFTPRKPKQAVRSPGTLTSITNEPSRKPEICLIGIKRVMQISGFGNSFIHERLDFPQPIRLGTSLRSASRWIEGEVVAWVKQLESSRNRPAPIAVFSSKEK